MKILLDKLPHSATLQDVIREYNKTVDKLNEGLCEIDEENISEAVMKRIDKEDNNNGLHKK